MPLLCLTVCIVQRWTSSLPTLVRPSICLTLLGFSTRQSLHLTWRSINSLLTLVSPRIYPTRYITSTHLWSRLTWTSTSSLLTHHITPIHLQPRLTWTSTSSLPTLGRSTIRPTCPGTSCPILSRIGDFTHQAIPFGTTWVQERSRRGLVEIWIRSESRGWQMFLKNKLSHRRLWKACCRIGLTMKKKKKLTRVRRGGRGEQDGCWREWE